MVKNANGPSEVVVEPLGRRPETVAEAVERFTAGELFVIRGTRVAIARHEVRKGTRVRIRLGEGRVVSVWQSDDGRVQGLW